ncbi:MAG: IclR family transcriptional regulator [Thermomicrobiales bacterium]
MSDTAERGAVKSLTRGLDILETMAAHPDGLTLSEIYRTLDLPKSSTHALLHNLLARNYVMNGRRDRTYRLGARLFQLGNAFVHGIDLVVDGQETVRAVSRRCDETVHLATLEGRDVFYVAKEEGTSYIRMVSALGKRVPAHGTGVGKMLLSSLHEDALTALYPPERPPEQLTAKTIAQLPLLKTELVRTRERGFALDDEESTVGLRCVAAPIYDAGGTMVAAMSISIPVSRWSPERQQELLAFALAGARELSERLGHVVP